MRRRTLLALPAAVAAFPAARLPFRLSVRVEHFFPGMPLPAQMEKVAAAGYQGFEFGNWRAADARQVTEAGKRLGLECACLVGNQGVNPKGMGLCDPAEREGFLAEMRASVEAARRFESKRLVVLTGFKVRTLSRDAQHASIVEGLKRAHDIVAPHGITLIVEVVNTLAPVEPLNPTGNNHADYFLDRTTEAFEIVQQVGSPFVKILFDLYHVQIMEGNLIARIKANIGAIGHIHVGDVPQRNEPGTGEINFPNVFHAIRDTGYRDFVAMEYIPTKDATQTLVETRRMAEAS
jgi:hydroxypyruvate isomerase